jgi:hypothetical protein
VKGNRSRCEEDSVLFAQMEWREVCITIDLMTRYDDDSVLSIIAVLQSLHSSMLKGAFGVAGAFGSYLSVVNA